MKPIITLLLIFLFTQCYAQNCDEPNSLISVRKRKSGKTEYAIFTLKKAVIANNTITDAQPPFIQDGSGNTINVSGCKYKQLTFKNLVWTCKSKEIWGTTTIIRQVKHIGQFEGVITYVIGYRCTAKSVADYEYYDGDYKKVVVRIKG